MRKDFLPFSKPSISEDDINEEIIPLSAPDYEFTHPWHLFIVRIDTEKSGMIRDEFMNELKKRKS